MSGMDGPLEVPLRVMDGPLEVPLRVMDGPLEVPLRVMDVAAVVELSGPGAADLAGLVRAAWSRCLVDAVRHVSVAVPCDAVSHDGCHVHQMRHLGE